MNNKFDLTITNNGSLKLPNYFAIALLSFGLIVICLFIYNSIIGDGVKWIKIVFAVLGIGGLIGIYRGACYFLIPIKGSEKLKFKEKKIFYSGTWKFLYRNLKINCSDIKEIKLLTKESDSYAQKNIFFNIKYGLIIIQFKNFKALEFGHNLEKEKLLELRQSIEKYCS